MMFVTDWRGQVDVLARAACGVIEVADERLVGVRVRAWPGVPRGSNA